MRSEYILAVCAYACALFVGGCWSEDGDDIVLNIPQGKLVGEWRTSFSGQPYGAFEGIPYARPPVGERRFRDPERAQKWYGVWQAKNLSNVCVQWYDQFDSGADDVTGNEDCLYINVYSSVPNVADSPKLPVIVYIHGGAFIFGSGTEYGPDFLMDHKVVYVNLNYRLGILGFLSTQDKALPGNLGLKDQSMALQWIKDNIYKFGGDPESVTITGMSAGGASVHYHMLSPMSKGLFHRAISMSGTALCPWTLQDALRDTALRVGEAMGCPTASSAIMIECLQQRPAAQIVKTVNKLMPFHHTPFSPVSPVIEPFSTRKNFISHHPMDIIKKNLFHDVPWLVSVTAQEGLYPAAIYAMKDEYLEHIAANWDSLVPFVFDYNNSLPLEKHAEASQKIKDYYFSGKDFSKEELSRLVDAISDRHFKVDSEKAARLQAAFAKSPIYYYYFKYRGATSLGSYLSHQPVDLGVCHGDDTGYVLKTVYINPTTTPEDIEMMKVMTNMWVSFATDGKPILSDETWLPVSIAEELDYLEIGGPNTLGMTTFVHTSDDPTAFWGSLGFNENENFKPLPKPSFQFLDWLLWMWS